MNTMPSRRSPPRRRRRVRCSRAAGCALRPAAAPGAARRSRRPAACAPRSTSAIRSSRAAIRRAARRSASRSTSRARSPPSSACRSSSSSSTRAARSVEAVKSGQADVGFFAIDPLRSDGIRFSAPYVLIEGAYLVRNDSPLRDNDEVDRPGTRIVVGRGSAYDLYLSARAQVGRAGPRADLARGRRRVPGAERRRRRRRQAAARGRRRARRRRSPAARPLHGDRAGDGHARRRAATPPLAALAGFVERAKASGFVAAALARHGIQGALVAPAARP